MSAPDPDGRPAGTAGPASPTLTLVAAAPESAAQERRIVDAPPLVPDLEDEDFMLSIEDMDADSCPPDMRFYLGDREAWVYDHGDIADLVFVRL